MNLINEYLKFNTWGTKATPGESKYLPHQSSREKLRRIRQVEAGQLEMNGAGELFVLLMRAR